MAGYFIYTLDANAFNQLASNPTDEQATIIANELAESVDGSDQFPENPAALAAAIKTRLASADWYANLDEDDAEIWDEFVFSLCDEVGEQLKIGFECSDYESIYWDCAEECVKQGVEMLKEPTFGSSGFRFHGELSHEFGYHRIYSIFDPANVKKLAEQLTAVKPHFDSLPGDEEGSVKEQFLAGLLAPVEDAANRGRYLFVQTDT